MRKIHNNRCQIKSNIKCNENMANLKNGIQVLKNESITFVVICIDRK